MSQNYILERIRITRERLKFSQKEIADHLGVTQPTYSKKESIPSRMSVEELVKVAEFLKVSISYLTSSEEDWSKTEILIETKEASNKRKIWKQSSEIGQLKRKIYRIQLANNQNMDDRVKDYWALNKEKNDLNTRYGIKNAEWFAERDKLKTELNQLKIELIEEKSKLSQLSYLVKKIEKSMIKETLDFFTVSNLIALFGKVEGVNLKLNDVDFEKTELILKFIRDAFQEISETNQAKLKEFEADKN